MQSVLNELDGDQPLSIEVPRSPRTTTCGECGRSATQTTGFVYRSGDAYAIYHAVLHHHGDGPKVDLAIGIGDWQGDDAVASASAFLAVWTSPDEVRFGFLDPANSVWKDSRLLRNQLTAYEAGVGTVRRAMLAIAELVVSGDPSVAGHLA